ncbi:MAG: hypothetical protein V9G19_22005 [Tetrasphaera sp.]
MAAEGPFVHVDQLARHEDACRVDQNVRRAEFRRNAIHRGKDGFPVGDVDRDRQRAATIGLRRN